LFLANSDLVEPVASTEYEAPAVRMPVSSKPSGLFLEWDLFSKMNFDDGVFADDYISMTGVNFGYTFESQFVIGYQGNFSFLFDPDLDSDENLLFDDDLKLSAHLLYLRRNWAINEKFTGFAQLGYSQVKTEVEVTNYYCFIICDSSTTTVYKNKETGTAWGLGLQWETDGGSQVSLKYIDYSDSPFEFEGFHIGLSPNLWQ